MNKEKQIVRLGEELLHQEDEILLNRPEVSFEKNGYVEAKSRDELLKYHPEVVLYCPQIPQNTGSISRLCAAFSSTLHLIEPMPFQITEKSVLRAGLDYWQFVNVFIHQSFAHFKRVRGKRRCIFVETGGALSPSQFQFKPGDLLIFGAETFGIPKEIIEEEMAMGEAYQITIPMFQRGVRSINLANSVALILYLAVAQLNKV